MTPPLLFSGSSHPELTQQIANLLEIKVGELSLKTFPDGEISVEICEDVRNRDVYILQSIALNPNFYLMELLIIIDALRRSSAKSITAIIPYFGYARQDKIDAPRTPITAKLLANLLTKSGAGHIITMELHSPQVEGFFDIPLDHLSSHPILIKRCLELELNDFMMVSPDIGGSKIASSFARELGVKMAIIDKRRLSPSQVEHKMFIGDVKDRDVIITDDMCSTGGTLISAAEVCRRLGAKRIFAVVTHGVCVENSIKRLENSPLESLLMTNSIPYTDRLLGTDKIKMVSIAQPFADAIRKNQSS